MNEPTLITMDDIKAAEAAFYDALRERRELSRPENWKAHEAIAPDGRKSIIMHREHFDMVEHLDNQLKRAHDRVIATRRAWLGM